MHSFKMNTWTTYEKKNTLKQKRVDNMTYENKLKTKK